MTGGNTSVFLERYAAATVYSCDVCDDDFCRQIYDCVERASAYMCLCSAVKILDSQSVSQSASRGSAVRMSACGFGRESAAYIAYSLE